MEKCWIRLLTEVPRTETGAAHVACDHLPLLGRDVAGRLWPIVLVLLQEWVEVLEQFLSLDVAHWLVGSNVVYNFFGSLSICLSKYYNESS